MSILFFLIGLFLGSFLLVIVERFPRNESIFVGRSHCDMCNHTLSWYDLIPVFSYLFQRGKCRYCHKPYGGVYPFVEILSGLLFASVILFFPSLPLVEQIVLSLAMCCFVVIFFCDIRFGLIPDGAVIVFTILACIKIFLQDQSPLPFFLSAICASGFFYLLYIITKKKGIGFGDIKLAFPIGLFLGYPLTILSIYLAFLTGAVVALILILRRKKKFRGDTISFGPFLIIGTYISLVGGLPLWNFLLHMLLGV